MSKKTPMTDIQSIMKSQEISAKNNFAQIEKHGLCEESLQRAFHDTKEVVEIVTTEFIEHLAKKKKIPTTKIGIDEALKTVPYSYIPTIFERNRKENYYFMRTLEFCQFLERIESCGVYGKEAILVNLKEKRFSGYYAVKVFEIALYDAYEALEILRKKKKNNCLKKLRNLIFQ